MCPCAHARVHSSHILVAKARYRAANAAIHELLAETRSDCQNLHTDRALSMHPHSTADILSIIARTVRIALTFSGCMLAVPELVVRSILKISEAA